MADLSVVFTSLGDLDTCAANTDDTVAGYDKLFNGMTAEFCSKTLLTLRNAL